MKTRSRSEADLRTLLRVAAAVIVLVGGSLIWKSAQNNTSEGTRAHARVFETVVGQTHALRLPDGSRVVLGPTSRLRIGEGYGTDARVVELNGEALFDVDHDNARPFTVRTATATVRDLGTRFTVRSVAGSPVKVAVTSGSVVLHANAQIEAKGVLLRAGDLGVLDGQGLATVFLGTVNDADTAFAKGRLVFREANLYEVATELERWYGVTLKLNDALAERHITASFHGESKEQVLNVIGLALGVEIELNGDTATLSPR